MEEQKTINIDEEIHQSELVGNNWKPAEGLHNVNFLKEPEPTKFIDDEGNTKEQVRLSVDVGSGPQSWFIGRGKKTTSVWIQLCKKVKDLGGGFTGQQVQVKVLGVGKERRYTVL